MSPSFSCGRLFYCSSVAPLDLHVEVILMRIGQLCATFLLTLRRYDRLVHPPHQLPFPPPPRRTPLRIIKSADQQAIIFLHQKLKVGSSSALPFLFPFPPPFPSSCLPPTSTSMREY
ncbi:hypothetical protein B0H13DRAFT_2327746 [Mycena leptocephala]|nr:hypothetical protein B0H13DRAFT_2327746 [Mycena leptocephala]